MRRIKLIVAYDGTNYCGWQVQPNGITVQEVLNQALSDLFAKKTACIGASRTDAGVHALGNVAVFDTDARMPADRIAFALNTRLPADIRIQGSSEVPPDFHPRFTATVKTYEYRILNRTFADPTRRLNSYSGTARWMWMRCGRQHRIWLACMILKALQQPNRR